MFAIRDFVKVAWDAVGVVLGLRAALLAVGPEHGLKGLGRICCCSATLILMPVATNANPLTTMDEVGAAIISCWKPPAGVKESTVSLSFSLKSDGSLVGPPHTTFINVTGDEEVRKQFVAAARDAVARCTPVELSPALAQGIGGQPFTMEFASSDRAGTISPEN